MTAELRALRQHPFELLQQLETRLRAARLDVVAGQAEAWVGLGFRVADFWLTSPKEDVREVINPPRLTRVPNAKPWLTGVANVRGELLPVIDLRQFLGLPPSETLRAQRVLVFNSERVPAGFLVDEVAGYRQFTSGEQRSEVQDGKDNLRPYLLGGFVREGTPWLAFSLHKVAQSDTFKHAGY